jgi:YbbR domain-containing protein
MSARALILNNFWLKVFSLALATILWMAIHWSLRTVSSEPQPRAPEKDAFPRPIMLMTAPDDHQAYVVEPLAVNVKVSGDADVIKKLNLNDIQVYVDLTDVHVVHGAFPVKYKLPRNVTLQQLWPSHVHVEPAKTQ